VIDPITLSSGNYILEVRGDVIGAAGGGYGGILRISPVPEAGEWLLMLLGLALIAFIAARRNRKTRMELGMNREGAKVIGTFIDALSWDEALTRITAWAQGRESRYVCICNVHSLVTASQDAEFNRAVSQADMSTPDGMPVACMLRSLGFSGQERINGPDLMWKYCERAARSGEVVYFYGSTSKTLQLLSAKLRTAFPTLRIGGFNSPPFRAVSEPEDEAIVASINRSGAGVVFVGLGCPKQEKWMASHRDRIHAVMIGVGAAFDYHAGTVQRAPMWMQRCGLEWLHRLCSEPRRLWKRYLVTNTIFVIAAGWQLYFQG
jgi:N-acetylglucosaminyldiphosphoundecaprenol N-acetyl-beta-D-mannosaminyltransferase